ncbi:phasin family protein [Massilia solisilvae]|uniref:Phasin family protein n=1 Tax=Massilia solisilvae TaxID=1811225 RepID=A0ABT2BG24_9BURK|nr:phasin family protein [Massilia solisilvae]MCS0607468.1 phasin family protein [Massilia solisilvae]
MYPFPQAVSPAIKSHLDAQATYLNDVARSMFHSFQQVCDLNIQLMQAMLEESAQAGRQLLAADGQTEVLGAAASRAQPATDKLRAWQQHLSRLAADTQVELARVTEQHAQNTARTARALADEVARTTSEQAERGVRTQQETMRRVAEPFAHAAEASAAQAAHIRTGGPQPMQSAAPQGASQGGAQPANAQHG